MYMRKDYLEISTDKKEKRNPSKKRKAVEVIVNVLLIVSALISVAVLSGAIFQTIHKNKYGLVFVHGQSMYPTLNKDAKYRNGSLIGRHDNTNGDGNYDVDYAFIDESKEAIENLKRFDIVTTTYNLGSSVNIKRVIAFPNETFYISMTTPGDEGNGNLFIKNKETNEFELIPQPISNEIVHGGLYTEAYAVETTLGDNEYFVMGDNRYLDYSYDCRNPSVTVTKEDLRGRLVGLEGYCSLYYNYDEHKLYVDQIRHYFPWRYF